MRKALGILAALGVVCAVAISGILLQRLSRVQAENERLRADLRMAEQSSAQQTQLARVEANTKKLVALEDRVQALESGRVTAAPLMSDPRSSARTQPGAADPLMFYRKNPELMKRYFPQLYRAENPPPAPPADE